MAALCNEVARFARIVCVGVPRREARGYPQADPAKPLRAHAVYDAVHDSPAPVAPTGMRVEVSR
jgi:hypothetical protein